MDARPSRGTAALAVAAAFLIAMPVAATDVGADPSPVPAEAAMPVLDGTWGQLADPPFGSNFGAGGWTGDAAIVAPSSKAQPSPLPRSDAENTMAAVLFDPVDPGEVPFSYSCGAGLPLTADGIAGAIPVAEASSPISVDALATMSSLDWTTDWRVIADDGQRAMIAALSEPDSARPSLYYVIAARGPEGWEWQGEGGCDLLAFFASIGGVGGYWVLDQREPAPGPDSTSIAIKVWDYAATECGVTLRGKPRVVLTENAVVVAIPVKSDARGDTCVPSPPTRLKIELPEPLGDRVLLDGGHLPLRWIAGPTSESSPSPTPG